jgi:hypothetical protein
MNLAITGREKGDRVAMPATNLYAHESQRQAKPLQTIVESEVSCPSHSFARAQPSRLWLSLLRLALHPAP